MNNGQWKVTWLSRNLLPALFLLAVTFVAHQPVWRIGYIKAEGIDADLSSWQGLNRIWTGQGQQTAENQYVGPGKAYYPLAHTTYWLEYHLWGLNPLGYYLDNVLLHGLSAVVLWLILRRLTVPGAWLGAALWALHPVNVESVAWIEERKNTLSGFLFLCSTLAALKYWLPKEGKGQPPLREGPTEDSKNLLASTAIGAQGTARSAENEGNYQSLQASIPTEIQHGSIQFYWVALALYALSLLSKTTTIPLPVVILLLVWWKRGRVLWRDMRPLLIFPVIGIAMGLDTMHVEHNLSKWTGSGNFGTVFALPLVDRFFIAGRDVWFYLGKLLWPHPLIFNYPRWKIEPISAMECLQLLAVPALLWLLWLKRHNWGRPLFVALLYFLVMLVPVLSFLNAMFFRRSFVADHYQYLPCIGPLTLAAAGIVAFLGRFGKAGNALKPLLSAGLLLVLGLLTWNQCRIYVDPETFYKTTLALNPDAWLMRAQYAGFLGREGRADAAIEQFRMALQTQPDAETSCRLGAALLDERKPDEAMVCFRQALQIQPDNAMAYDGLARACIAMGQTDEAIQDFQKALQIQPDMPLSCYSLGNAYMQEGQLDLAIQYWQKTVAIQPDFAPAHSNLGNALLMKGQVAEAIQHWRSALTIGPNLPAQVGLAWVLATCPQESIRDGTDAVGLAERANQMTGGRNPVVLRTLAAAYAENGQFSYAVATAQQALQIAQLQHNVQLGATIGQQLKFYQNGQPFRDTSMPSH